jgi:hypothetical protein
MGLIHRDVVGLAVCDLPLALLAAEDVGDAQVYGSTATPATEFAMCSKPIRYAMSPLAPAATRSKR